MKVEYLQEFLTLTKLLNYAAAADALYISASALSRHIMALESEIGTELFHRGWRNISLTLAGRLLVPAAERMVAEQKSYYDALAKEYGIQTQTLTIRFVRCIVQYGMMDKLVRYRNDNPELSVILSESNPTALYSALKNNECNFGLGYAYDMYYDKDLEVVPLIRDTVAVALPVTHPLADRDHLRMEDIKEENFILHPKGGASYKHAMKLFHDAGYSPTILTNAENGQYILELVSKRIGISFVEKDRFQAFCPPDVRIIDLYPAVEKQISLFFKRHVLSPVEKLFLEFAASSLRDGLFPNVNH